MKYYITILIILFVNSINCQVDTTYFDNNFDEIKNSNTAQFYRIQIEEDTAFIEKDFYITGDLYKKGTLKSIYKPYLIGETIWYYKNGNIKQIGYYDEYNNEKGKWTSFYVNGQKKQIGNYDELNKYLYFNNGFNDKRDLKIFNRWNKDGSIQIKDGEGEYFEYFENDSLKLQGTISNYLREQKWTAYFSNRKLNYIEVYKEGKVISGISYRNSIEYTYDKIRTNAYSKECNNIKEKEDRNRCIKTSFHRYIRKRMQYPSEALDEGLSGRVYIGFIVEKDGTISTVKLLRGVHKILDDEALKLIRNIPKMKPAKIRGINSKSNYQIPISFRLE